MVQRKEEERIVDMNSEERKKLKEALFEILEKAKRDPDSYGAALEAAGLLIKMG